MDKFDVDKWASMPSENETLAEVESKIHVLESKEIVDCNILKVTVGTTGYKGGDTMHGSRTLFELKNMASTDMRVSINDGELEDVEKVTLVFGGDSELDTFKEALLFAYKILEGIEPKMTFIDKIKCAWKYKDLRWLRIR